MTDREIVDRILAGDAQTVREFFFERCRPALTYIGRYFCQFVESPEDLIGEFYEFLSADDWHKLRIFKFSCSLNSYVTIIASRYFQHKRDMATVPLDGDMRQAVKNIGQGGGVGEYAFFMDALRKIVKNMHPFDRFLIQRILIEGNKPGDILKEAADRIRMDATVSTDAADRKALAGYVYTRYNRARKSLRKSMEEAGYGR